MPGPDLRDAYQAPVSAPPDAIRDLVPEDVLVSAVLRAQEVRVHASGPERPHKRSMGTIGRQDPLGCFQDHLGLLKDFLCGRGNALNWGQETSITIASLFPHLVGEHL